MFANRFCCVLLSLCIALPAHAVYIADTGFSLDGRATVAFDFGTFKADQTLEMFPANAGGYYVAGVVSTTTQSGVGIGIAKFTNAGVPDGSFDSDGKISFETVFESLVDVAMDSQGRMVFVGSVAESSGPGSDIAVLRVLPNGNVDNGFGLFGMAAHDGGDYDEPVALAISPANHILVLARGRQSRETIWKPAVFGFENDGTSSTALGITTATYHNPEPSGAIAWSSQRGRAVIAFESIRVGNCEIDAFQINALIDGSGSIRLTNTILDGYTLPGVTACTEVSVQAITAAADGSIFLAGFIPPIGSSGSTSSSGWVMKIGQNNILDAGFDGDGVSYQTAPFPYASIRFNSIALDTSGRALVGGRTGDASGSSYSFALQRLTAAGIADSTFSAGFSSVLVTAFNGSGGGPSIRNEARSVLVESNRILLAGSTLWAAPVDFDFAIAAWSEPTTTVAIFANGFE